MNFEEVKAKILKHGLLDITMQEDKTWMSFVLTNGEMINLYTEELSVPIVDDNGEEVGEDFVQGEIIFMAGDLS